MTMKWCHSVKCPANVIIGGFWNVLGDSPEAVYCIVDCPKKQNIGRGEAKEVPER